MKLSDFKSIQESDEVFAKTSWCRGPECLYHPATDDKKSFFTGLNKKFSLDRCLSCKRHVDRDFYVAK